jgi:hypothetical protein
MHRRWGGKKENKGASKRESRNKKKKKLNAHRARKRPPHTFRRTTGKSVQSNGR